jgi:hypothetical protein
MEHHDEDDEPELAGYEPHDRPLRGRHFLTILRVVVVLGLVGLVLPGILVTVSTANRTATASCALYAQFYAPGSTSSEARFDLVSAAGPGWNCYAMSFGGDEILVASLGLIPGGVSLPSGPLERS